MHVIVLMWNKITDYHDTVDKTILLFEIYHRSDNVYISRSYYYLHI